MFQLSFARRGLCAILPSFHSLGSSSIRHSPARSDPGVTTDSGKRVAARACRGAVATRIVARITISRRTASWLFVLSTAKKAFESGQAGPFRMVTLVAGDAGVGKTFLKKMVLQPRVPEERGVSL